LHEDPFQLTLSLHAERCCWC